MKMIQSNLQPIHTTNDTRAWRQRLLAEDKVRLSKIRTELAGLSKGDEAAALEAKTLAFGTLGYAQAYSSHINPDKVEGIRGVKSLSREEIGSLRIRRDRVPRFKTLEPLGPHPHSRFTTHIEEYGPTTAQHYPLREQWGNTYSKEKLAQGPPPLKNPPVRAARKTVSHSKSVPTLETNPNASRLQAADAGRGRWWWGEQWQDGFKGPHLEEPIPPAPEAVQLDYHSRAPIAFGFGSEPEQARPAVMSEITAWKENLLKTRSLLRTGF